MGILVWIVVGMIVGAIAKLLMPWNDSTGIAVTMVLGIVGAVLGGAVGRAVGIYPVNAMAEFIMTLGGAAFILLIYKLSLSAARRS